MAGPAAQAIRAAGYPPDIVNRAVEIQPHAQKAFDLLVDHVEAKASLPRSQCIAKGARISGNPAEPGHCAKLLVPSPQRRARRREFRST